MTMEETGGIRAAERALHILELLCAQPSLGVSELARLSGLHKATVFRLLQTLEGCGYVRQDAQTGQYFLTPKLLRLASSLPGTDRTVSCLHPLLYALSDACGETVHLVGRDGDSVLYLDKVEQAKSSVRLVSRVGLAMPMTCTAVGKAILASGTDAEVRELWARTDHPAHTAHTVTELPLFLEELAHIRRCGYAVDREENELGVRCVAVALAAEGQRADYAVSVSGPLQRMTDGILPSIAEQLLRVRGEALRFL